MVSNRRDRLLEMFQRFDENGDGVISKDELQTIFTAIVPKDFDMKKFDIIFDAADTNGDGDIQYDEFVNLLFSITPKDAVQGRAAAKHCGLEYRTWLPERFEVDISKRYALDKLEVGEGCYGKVFVATDKECEGRIVAVKKITKTSDHVTNENFYREIEIMKELDHANICKLFGTHEEGRNIFLVMEYCEGGELFDRIVKDGHISESLSATILAQVASALRYAHSLSICHRDLKPENVVFCSRDPLNTMVKIIDWGLGISFAGTKMRSAVGSFTYSAPEVIVCDGSEGYSSSCDLWSLGVVAYVMLCGTAPFDGSLSQHVKDAMAEKYSLDGEIWSATSEEAKDFVQGLLRADPEKRTCIKVVGQHPWLQSQKRPAMDLKDTTAQGILANIRASASKSLLTAICSTAVAKFLNHVALGDIYDVFQSLDENGDGVLSLEELKNGFIKVFGKNAVEYKDIEVAFSSMDLNRSGAIDYTEFCAASLGEKLVEREEAIFPAFKSFDVDNTGKISKNELRQVLVRADVQKAWTPWLCETLVNDFLNEFDTDGDGEIDFQEWKKFMHKMWDNRFDQAACDSPESVTNRGDGTPSNETKLERLSRKHQDEVSWASERFTRISKLSQDDFGELSKRGACDGSKESDTSEQREQAEPEMKMVSALSLPAKPTAKVAPMLPIRSRTHSMNAE